MNIYFAHCMRLIIICKAQGWSLCNRTRGLSPWWGLQQSDTASQQLTANYSAYSQYQVCTALMQLNKNQTIKYTYTYIKAYHSNSIILLESSQSCLT